MIKHNIFSLNLSLKKGFRLTFRHSKEEENNQNLAQDDDELGHL
jgi:hypothetical protein